MAIEIRIPQLGESVTEAVIAHWIRQDGEEVKADEPVLEIETEKAAMEIAAETSGRLEVLQPVGARVPVGTVVARIVPAAAERADSAPAVPRESAEPADRVAPASEPRPIERVAATSEARSDERAPAAAPSSERNPAAAEARSDQRAATESGSGDRVPAADEAHSESRPTHRAGDPLPVRSRAQAEPAQPLRLVEGETERVPMSEIRRTIAARLVEAQQAAAILTTFNEVDMSEVFEVRTRYRERFKTRHAVDLGFMSLFARAVIGALEEFPVVNARIDGGDVVYHRRVHLGIAVATRRGLVVPVVRNADTMPVADLERAIGNLAERARDGKLAPDDLRGGTFSITNGGVFGSLLSTPLLNPPQSGILGMHRIQERPVAVAGQVAIRPMMYVALSYDHRLVDGEQAVRFLVRVKEQVEDPARMLLDV